MFWYVRRARGGTTETVLHIAGRGWDDYWQNTATVQGIERPCDLSGNPIDGWRELHRPVPTDLFADPPLYGPTGFAELRDVIVPKGHNVSAWV
jgi:hypothetical protein